ncbi:MAG TPA: ATP-dependent metallopeptidase FtsH/Yme1/Tma family protein [Clostridiales bacterium]|nr:ATP-dependent metallopeptidase FtsH/Yme1/Tma family protein [Clostridiales bacterium]
MKKVKKIHIIAVVLVISAVIAGILFANRSPEPEKITYNQFLQAVEYGNIGNVYLGNSDLIKGEYKNGKTFVTDNPRKEDLKEFLLMKDIEVEEMTESIQGEQLLSMVFTLGVFGVLIFVVNRNVSKQKQGNVGKSFFNAVLPENVNVNFSNVAGNEEAKESVQELVDFIKNPEKYTRYGARLPRGVIFYGAPGTGKTLMAKAVAGESGVPFIAVSGSDFVQVYVGVGASRIRDLFKKARSYGKCVIFIDEIDALGKKRDGADGGGNDERDQTLNALLSEMSGFQDNEGIVVIAATNRLDILDEALLRPGRFDRHIEIQLPDVKSRLRILELHARNKPIDKGVSLEKLAQQTVYFSGAKLENLLNEAAILAAKRSSGYINADDIDRAFYTVIAGAEKKDRSTISEQDRRLTAFHEAGHALVTKFISPENRVSRVTIIPSTKGAGGFSMNIPPDRMYHKKKDMENSIKIALAGRAAEELIFGEENITTGASNDLEKATETLLNMIRRFGMNSKSGLLNYDVLYNNGFHQVQNEILEECKARMDMLYNEVKELLAKNIKILEAVAESLLSLETLDEKELDLIIQAFRKAG